MSGQRSSKSSRTNTSAVKVNTRPSVQTQTMARETGGHSVSLDGIRDAQASMGQLSKALSGFFGGAMEAADMLADTQLRDDLHAAKIKNAQEAQQAFYDANMGKKDQDQYDTDWDYRLAHDRATQGNEITEKRRLETKARRTAESEAYASNVRKAAAGDFTAINTSGAAGAYGTHLVTTQFAEDYKARVREKLEALRKAGASPEQITDALNRFTADYIKGVAGNQKILGVPEKYRADVLAVVKSGLRDASRRQHSADAVKEYQALQKERRSKFAQDFDNSVANWKTFNLGSQIKSYQDAFGVGPQTAQRAIVVNLMKRLAAGSLPQDAVHRMASQLKDAGVVLTKEQVSDYIRATLERDRERQKSDVRAAKAAAVPPAVRYRQETFEKDFGVDLSQIKVRMAQGDQNARKDLDAFYAKVQAAWQKGEVGDEWVSRLNNTYATMIASEARAKASAARTAAKVEAGYFPANEKEEAAAMSVLGQNGLRNLMAKGYVPFSERKKVDNLVTSLQRLSPADLKNNTEVLQAFKGTMASVSASYASRGGMSPHQWARQYGANSGLMLQMAQMNVRSPEDAHRLLQAINAHRSPDYWAYVGQTGKINEGDKTSAERQRIDYIKKTLGGEFGVGSLNVIDAALKEHGGRIAMLAGMDPVTASTEQGLKVIVGQLKERGLIREVPTYTYDGKPGPVRYYKGASVTPRKFPEETDVAAMTKNIVSRITTSMSNYGVVKSPFLNMNDMKNTQYIWQANANGMMTLSTAQNTPLKVYSGQTFYKGDIAEADHDERTTFGFSDSGGEVRDREAHAKNLATKHDRLPGPEVKKADAAKAFKRIFNLKDPRYHVTVTDVGGLYEYTVSYNVREIAPNPAAQ